MKGATDGKFFKNCCLPWKDLATMQTYVWWEYTTNDILTDVGFESLAWIHRS